MTLTCGWNLMSCRRLSTALWDQSRASFDNTHQRLSTEKTTTEASDQSTRRSRVSSIPIQKLLCRRQATHTIQHPPSRTFSLRTSEVHHPVAIHDPSSQHPTQQLPLLAATRSADHHSTMSRFLDRATLPWSEAELSTQTASDRSRWRDSRAPTRMDMADPTLSHWRQWSSLTTPKILSRTSKTSPTLTLETIQLTRTSSSFTPTRTQLSLIPPIQVQRTSSSSSNCSTRRKRKTRARRAMQSLSTRARKRKNSAIRSWWSWASTNRSSPRRKSWKSTERSWARRSTRRLTTPIRFLPWVSREKAERPPLP